MHKRLFLIGLLITSLVGCKQSNQFETTSTNKQEIPGMVWIPGGIYDMGASDGDRMALPHEKPKHTVKVDGFYMDQTEVTNAQFSKFIEATNYITTAERPVDWDLIKQQLPPGTPNLTIHFYYQDLFCLKKQKNRYLISMTFRNGGVGLLGPIGKNLRVKEAV